MPPPRTTALRGSQSRRSSIIHRIDPACLAQFVRSAEDVVVHIVRLAHPVPGQPRKEHGNSPGIVSPAAFGTFVQVLRQHQVERHGV